MISRGTARRRTRVIAIDIDGTLLPSTGTVVSDRNREALLRAQAAGVEVVIATGRRQAYAMPLLCELGLRPETVMISSNGTVTRTFGGERLDRWLLPVATARRLSRELPRFGGTTVFTFDRVGRRELVIESLDELSHRIEKWVEANREHLEVVVPLERAFDEGEAPVQGMVCGTVAAMRAAEQQLRADGFADQVAMQRTEYPARDLSILDILPAGCSKGSALERLAARLGVEREEIAAIGDNYNDLEMLEYVGEPVLMANAAPGLLEIASERGWHITGNNDQDGVAMAIEALLTGADLEGADLEAVAPGVGNTVVPGWSAG
jgi:Cof subfamily protein (haloacid dehalogenase superfamily)